MKEKTDRKQLGGGERSQLEHMRRAQYAKALRRAGKALLAADAALATVEAFGDELQTFAVMSERQRVQIAEKHVRMMLGEQKR